MAMDDQNQKKSPGQSLVDAATSGYDKGAQKKANNPKIKKDVNKGKGIGNASAGIGMDDPAPAAVLGSRHKGGKIKKTGLYRLKKGEIVLTSQQQKAAGLKGKKKSGTRKRVSSKG